VIRVTHVITGLATGGAEMMLYKLVSALDRAVFASDVVSLLPAGPIGEKIAALGVPVRSLGMQSGMPDPLAVARLAGWLRRRRPNVVQTWMYHADLVGGLAARLAGGVPVAWNIQQSNVDPRLVKRSTRATIAVCARLSRWLPTRIVCCAEVSRQVHVAQGYAADRMVLIPNACDLDRFRPDPAARAAVQEELGLSADAPLVGLVARFDPQKDHRTFVAAAARLRERLPAVQFLLCGDGIGWDNAALAGWLRAVGIAEACHLLGPRDDVPRIMAALDVAVLSSAYGEGFPNVLGEAMGCAVPCVATDVGDSARIVAATGRVVPPRDSAALAGALHEVLALDPAARQALGQAARQRVVEHFALPACVAQYAALYAKLATGARGRGQGGRGRGPRRRAR
jgi:glycosyltransferase involved in cell wall biosynthesis